MPKINQEEYETLKKKQRKGHKYIAREKEGHVIVFTDYHGKSEYRWLVTINEDDLKYESLFNSSKVFQFIQWEDEEPYNIQELIEEYEYSAEHVSHVVNERVKALGTAWSESEETEMKTLESIREEIWEEMLRLEDKRKDQWADIKYQTLREVLQKLGHLDEPEVLSQEFIDKYKVDYDNWMPAVPIVHLQNLLVPKQELPVIPKFVAEWIESRKNNYPFDVIGVYQRMNESFANEQTREVLSWIHETELNRNSFARAWLDGYETEQDPKYYAKIKGHENIGSNDKYWNYNTDMEELSIGDSEVHPNVISEYMVKATKDEWANLGITDDNADFELVEELKEC